ncbi:MAG: CPBP family intramembrane glutamic endopeptidase [Phycisphaerales bacterium]
MIFCSASAAMGIPEQAVIAAQQQVGDAVQQDATHAAGTPSPLQWVLVSAWAVGGLALAMQRGWLHQARLVRWRTNQLGDQVIMMCGLLVSGMVASVVVTLLGASAGGSLTSGASLLAMLTASAVTLGAWLMVRQPEPTGMDTRGTMPTSRAVVAGLIGLAIVWPWVSLVANIGNLVQSALGGATPPDVAHLTLDALREHVHEPSAWGVALVVVTLTPLTEEVVWRGAVQQALKRLGIPRLAAIGCTAVLFALVHWNAVPDASRLSALPALAMLGFALGWLMERTGRLIAPVAAHAAFNAANLLLFSMLG